MNSYHSVFIGNDEVCKDQIFLYNFILDHVIIYSKVVRIGRIVQILSLVKIVFLIHMMIFIFFRFFIYTGISCVSNIAFKVINEGFKIVLYCFLNVVILGIFFYIFVGRCSILIFKEKN